MIQNPLAAKIFASLLLLPITKVASETTTCAEAVKAPASSWQPGYTYSAVLAGKPLVSLPPKALGFNRTAVVSSICDKALFPSTNFKLVAGAPFRAVYQAVQPVTIQFSGANCKLSNIELLKTAPATHEMELHLEFDACVGGPAGLAVAVVMGVSSDEASTSNLLPWAQELKNAADPAPANVSTTENPEKHFSFSSNYLATPVGDGKCDAASSSVVQSISSKSDCQMQCVEASKKHKLMPTLATDCTGFAYNEHTNECILYKSASVLAIQSEDENWHCANVTDQPTQVDEVTTTQAQLVVTTAGVVAVDSVDFTQVFSASPVASLTQISSPVEEPTCLNPVWWFKLEDREGTLSSIAVKAADYQTLLELVPETAAPEKNVSAPRVMDRVLMDSCLSYQNQWGGSICQVSAPKTSNPKCTRDAMGNAMVTGVATAVATWLVVGLVFFLLSSPFRQNPEGYNKPDEQMDEKTVCKAQTVLFLSVVAIGASVGSSFGFMQLVNEALRSQICYDTDEALVIMLCTMLSAGLAIVIILQYIKRQHPRHGHPLFTQTKTQVPVQTPGPQLVLVPEDAQVGHIVNADAYQSLTPNGSINGSINGSNYASQRM